MSYLQRKARILFVFSHLSTFVHKDLEILERHFDIKRMKVETFLIPRKRRDLLVFLGLFKEVLWADVVFCWFANINAFFSVLFSIFLRKKSLVVVGGYDAAYLPEIDYGLFVNRWTRMETKFVYKHVNKILVVDVALKKDVLRNTSLSIGNKIEVIPTGYDPDKWELGSRDRENLVITVGAVERSNLKRKGFETFVKVAKYLPDVRFVLIGKHLDDSVHYLKSISSPNVDFPGFVSDSELLSFYQRARVYCQLSRYEGLPNSLCEAMMCGCVPVGTKYSGIPTAIGDVGFYVPYGNVEATVEGVKKALSSNERRREAARERIKKLFPLQKREKQLVRHIRKVLKKTD